MKRILVSALLTAWLCSSCSSSQGAPVGPEADNLKLGWRSVTPSAVALPAGRAFTEAQRDLSAGGPVLINFWASYCGPCKEEMPRLEAFSATGQVPVIGVDEDPDLDNGRQQIRRARVTYPNWSDSDQSYLQSLAAFVPAFLPSSILVVDGSIIAVHLGPFDKPADFAPITEYLKGS